MGILMRVCGEGSANGGTRRGATGSALLLALLVPIASLGGLLGGCANGSSGADTRVAVQVEPAKPEQVVQRIEPTPAPELVTQPARIGPPNNGAAAGAPDKRAPVKGGSISAKHLEAELNRLEAELK